MIWPLFSTFCAFLLTIFQDAPVDDVPYEASPVGPQSWREAHIAMQAIQGEHGDMRFHEDWPESAGINDESYRWEGYPGRATVPYVIDPSVGNSKNLILQAIEQYHKFTCIKFVHRTHERHYIHILSDAGCYSYVGCQRRGGQPVSLGYGCLYVGTIVHELGHAIGLYHEHQRSDRDNYINVYWNNVMQSQVHNFDKTPSNQEMRWGSYDYGSIMHYGSYAFSVIPGRNKTMEAKNGTPLKEPYEKPGLDKKDIDLIRWLYKCQ